ncbi:HAD hydrolase family protein [Brachyspira pilosicoli]|uniref:KdsC family phosphatase n=1 Tax=Brachyspira pilosicoli TaxID=52584 RepID=UPI003004B0E2
MNLKLFFSYYLNLKKLKKIKLFVFDVDGVMTDGKLIFDDNGIETKFFNTLDGMGIVMALKSGIKIAIITGSKAACVKKRFDKFKIHGFEDLIQGEEYKIPALLTLIEKYGLKSEEVAYMGDDVIDLAPIKYVGFSFAPKNAIDEVKKNVNIVLNKEGGKGAVRLAINMILKARGDYERIIKDFSSF